MGGVQGVFRAEARIYTRFLLLHQPNPKAAGGRSAAASL